MKNYKVVSYKQRTDSKYALTITVVKVDAIFLRVEYLSELAASLGHTDRARINYIKSSAFSMKYTHIIEFAEYQLKP